MVYESSVSGNFVANAANAVKHGDMEVASYAGHFFFGTQTLMTLVSKAAAQAFSKRITSPSSERRLIPRAMRREHLAISCESAEEMRSFLMIVGESVVDVDSDYSPGFCYLSHVSLFRNLSI